MKLYNTLTHQKEDLKPIKAPVVTLYTCGPTVYLEPHIGNWRNNIFYDVLIRTLKLSGFKPTHILNITDVGHIANEGEVGSDRVAESAKKLRKTAWDVAEYFTEFYLAGRKLLALAEPTKMPKATDHIKEQLLLIEILEKKGYTYKTKDGIYFDISKFKDYGELVGEGIKGMQAGARVEVNKEKKNPHDFALWKFSPKGEQRDMEWESKWGTGFPGWHLECSAMALEYLGETMDIHAGGVDLIFPHHTNEIAQSEGATGKTFANLWIHNEFLLSEGQKMAKSAGNYFTLTDLIEKKFHPLAFKLLVLQAHYRSQFNFTWKSLQAAQNQLQDLYAVADRQHQLHSLLHAEHNTEFEELIAKTKDAITNALADDLDTPAAVAALAPVVEYVNTHDLTELDKDNFVQFLKFGDSAFGLRLARRKDISDEQKQLIKDRQEARKNGEFEEADRLRDELATQAIGLNDTELGSYWYRILG